MNKILFLFISAILFSTCNKEPSESPEDICPGCKDNIWTDECESIDPPQAKGRLAYISYDGTDYEVQTMNTEGEDVRVLTRNNFHDVQPKWSPDGKRILFSSNRRGNFDLWVMFSDGRCQKLITQSNEDEIDPAWSPDGEKIVYVSYPEIGLSEIYTMNLNTGEIKQLTFNDSVDGKPAWSPDGTKIAFVSNRPGKYLIYTMNAENGSEQIQLPGTKISPNDNKEYPISEGVLGGAQWSPDGNMLAFSDSKNKYTGIAVVSIDGSVYKPITGDPYANQTYLDSEPAWSTDGKYIVYMTSMYGLGEIFKVNVETLDITRLTENTTSDGSPSWSPVK